jgi:hypothetical protein
MICPYYSSLFDHPHNIWWRAQIKKLLMQSFPPPVTSSLLGPNRFLTQHYKIASEILNGKGKINPFGGI